MSLLRISLHASVLRQFAAVLVSALFLGLGYAQQAPDEPEPGEHHNGSHSQGSHRHGENGHGQTGIEEPGAGEVLVHRFTDTQRWIDCFERPGRAEYQMPDRVVETLGVEPGQTVADIGAGSGYFSFRLARAVGAAGRVLAVDIEPGMLAAIDERRGSEEGGEVVETVLARSGDPLLPDGEVDLVLIVNTLHHIPDRVEYFRRLQGDLSSGGRIAVVDFQKRDLPVGPPPPHKLAREEVIATFEAAGYSLDQEETFLPYQYFLVFAVE
jgi:ubiquinone/menaquinone biosynthesis C-methylase UbiE